MLANDGKNNKYDLKSALFWFTLPILICKIELLVLFRLQFSPQL